MSLSKSDVRDIVAQIFRDTEVTVLDYEIVKKTETLQAFMSSPQFLHIRILKNGKTSTVTCFVKTMPDNDFHRSYALNTKVFSKEPFFYNKLAKDMMRFSYEKVIPECYLARENEIVVLEYMKDYSIKDINDLFNLEEMRAAVKALAVFHSSSLIFESKYNVKLDIIGEDYLTEHYYRREEGHFGLTHMKVSIRAFKAIIEKYFDLDPKTKQFVYDTYDNIPEGLVASNKYRNVICQGDIYGNNIMLKREGDHMKACIVDFQLARFSPPGHDLTLMIHSNFEQALYHEHYEELIEYYYECVQLSLESFGLDINIELPKENFISGLEDTKLVSLAVSSLFQHYVTIPAKQLEAIMTNQTLLHKFLLEDRTDVVMEAFETSTVYRNRVQSAIKEVINECERQLSKK